MTEARIQRYFLLLLMVGITIAFLAMIRPFLMTLLMAAILAGLMHPAYRSLVRLFRGRRVLASIVSLLLVLVLVVGPLTTLVGIVVGEAFKVTDAVRPWIQERTSTEGWAAEYLARLPFYDEYIEPYRAEIYQRVGQVVGGIGNWLVGSLSQVTKGTVNVLFHFGLLMYAMFFFLLDGRKMLRAILYYLPLSDEAEKQMVNRFVSVTRATIKGTLVIGILQGGLAGAAFAVAGIPSAVFWGTVMVVLSIVPGIGTALVWVPATIALAASGAWGAAAGLGVWCGLVVGSIDNVLRPRLVGQDTEMHDLLILFGTLGGIYLFGILGFLVGPILAALFVTVWGLYGDLFRDVLPKVDGLQDEDQAPAT